jgi:hypothetical protein
LASDGSFFIFMFWYSYKGLEPHLQRAHAGHTQSKDLSDKLVESIQHMMDRPKIISSVCRTHSK